jgi:Family of unknown function (DUF5681)
MRHNRASDAKAGSYGYKGRMQVESSAPHQPSVRGRPFRTGQSGNPQGKPRGVRNRATQLLDRMAESDAADVLRAVIKRAKGGDMAAAGMLMARVWPPRKGRAVTFDLPPLARPADLVAAFGMVVQAVGNGLLTPEEGQSVAAILEVQRRAIELCDLEVRVAKLEGERDAEGA